MDDKKLGIVCLTLISLAGISLVGYMAHQGQDVPAGIYVLLGGAVGSIGTAITGKLKAKIEPKE